MNESNPPSIIQGGMGVAVSDWRLARAVASRGQLGVVSGTAIDTVFIRRLQDGDPGGHMRRAMAHFPLRHAVDEALGRYFLPDGRPSGTRYRLLPLVREKVSHARRELLMLAAFVEVWLARQGHSGVVGINLLTKVQIPTLPTLYGAMLAGVDYVLMGAGIPKEIPGALDRLARHEPATLRLDVEGGGGPETMLEFDPRTHWDTLPPPMARPKFLPIVASNSLATLLARKASGRVDGFVVEGPIAGGHNAPPRGPARLDEHGEPIYGERDMVDLDALKALGLPFWVAGGSGHPDQLRAAREAGAAGVQVGTLFAYCDESGLAASLKSSVLEHALRGEVSVRTDPRASPTGYPFKVVQRPAHPGRDANRERICDLGTLRVPYRMADGRLGYRCPGEPEDDYVRKGGAPEDTTGRQCLCNGLTSAAGQPQLQRSGELEPPLVTSGDDLEKIAGFLHGRSHYSASDVIDFLLGGTSSAHSPVV
jgi:NAD(P)H-dependent flavin oxidoreductase YrpB (nitropropane dioxygenase family)